jgi:hypothetical protein
LASLSDLSYNLRFTTFWLLFPLSGFRASSLPSSFSEHGCGAMNSIKYYSESKEHSLQYNRLDANYNAEYYHQKIKPAESRKE